MAGPASSQTSDRFRRIDELAQYTVESVACTDLGFSLRKDEEALARAVEAENLAAGASAEGAKKLYEDAVARRLQTFGLDLQARKEAAFKSGNMGKALRQIFVERGEFCMRAAQDSLFARFLSQPESFDPNKAALELSDKLLEGGGLASWQTPKIQAQGDVVLIAGACRRQIGSARSDALFAGYTRTEDPRERDYYSKSFQKGLTDPDYADLDAQQCERAIRRLKAAVGG